MSTYCTPSIVETIAPNETGSFTVVRSLPSSGKVIKGKHVKCQGVVLLPVIERRAG